MKLSQSHSATAVATRDVIVHWVLRAGAALCFIGHGAFGFVTKESWIKYFNVVGLDREWGYWFMPLIGTADIFIGLLILLRPRKILLAYMVLWALWTAILRPLAGQGISEVWERAGNYGVPLALMLLGPGRWNGGPWFAGFGPAKLSADTIWRLVTLLQIVTALLLIGHAAFILFDHKQEIVHHWNALGIFPSEAAGAKFTRLAGIFELLLGAIIFLKPTQALLILAFLWKIFTELLYPISGDYWFEFIERSGSYAAPLTLFVILRTLPERRLEYFWPVVLIRRLPAALNSKTERSFVYAVFIFLALAFAAGQRSTGGFPTHDLPQGIVRPKEIALISGHALVSRLQAGGLSIYFRHFQTTAENAFDDRRQFEHGRLRTDDFKDCSWQRPLADFGVQRAKSVGKSIRTLKIPVGKVISSPYCRCVDSAKYVAGRDPEIDLNIVYRRKEHTRERMETFVDNLLKSSPVQGTNTLIFAHRPPMDSMGVIREGEAFVFEPASGGGYNLIAKIKAHEWVEALVDPSLLGEESKEGYYPPHL